MIKRFRIQNYKALRDVTLELTPIHVLIGPNDSGKTSILDAMAALCRSVDHELSQAFTGSWNGQSLVWRGEPDRTVALTATVQTDQETFDYLLSSRFPPSGRHATVGEETFRLASESWSTPGFADTGHSSSRVNLIAHCGGPASAVHKVPAQMVHDALGQVHSYRWVPRMLALPVASDSKRSFRMEASGFGLALCLDDILGYDRDSFDSLENRFTDIFPQVKSIKLKREPGYQAPTDSPEEIPMLSRADGKGIYFELKDGGHLVSAAQASDGILLVLAYLAVLFLPKPPRLLLVEEPENGIHPQRLQVVLKILKDLVEEQSHSQVILTTHSPYVVDLFGPNEVTLCHMQQDGSVSVRKLSDSKTVREQLDVFTLGEIWTAEGDEALADSPKADEEASK